MWQPRLFEVPELKVNGPPGFRYKADFITPQEEEMFLEEFRKTPLKNFQWEGYESKRRVRGFKSEFGYPEFFKPILKRVAAFAGVLPSHIKQALITEYSPGTQIGWHRDQPPYDKIIGLSFGSPVPFRLRKISKEPARKWERITVTAEPRSIYIMAGASRSLWQHSIPPVPDWRYSLTMRTVER